MRFLATADLHIKKKADCALLARILQKATDTDCRAILIGGDLLDSPFIDAETEGAVLALLGAADCPVFLVAGNHDPLTVTGLYHKLPDGVYCFSEQLTGVTLEEGIRLFGYSAPREENSDFSLAGFAAPGDGFNILLGHSQPEGDRSAFQPVSNEVLAAGNLQLAILGHVHKTEQRQVGGCRLLVPGIPQGRGWDETGERFVYLIDADPKGGLSMEPCSVAEKLYLEIPVELTGCTDSAEILARMEGMEIPAEAEVRLILTGSPEESPAAAAKLYTERTGREIKDRTDTFGSIALLREQNTLQGAFVRRAMAEIERADPADRPRLEQALRLGLNALKEARL